MIEPSVETVASPRARLPRLATARAEVRNRLLVSLGGLRVDGLRPRARVPERPAASACLVFDAGPGTLSLAADTIDGRPARRLVADASPDLPEVLLELSRLEPLIAALERACGQCLDPKGLSPAPGEGLAFQLRLADPAGGVVHVADIMVSEALAAVWPRHAEPITHPGLAALARAGVRLVLDGPSAPVGELDRLETGDFVLLPGAAGAARPARLVAGRRVFGGAFELSTSAFHANREETDMIDTPEASGPSQVADLFVRLQVLLPSLQVPVSDLAMLAPGSVLSLPIDGEDLRVELTAGGPTIARGRLVALDAAYGVLIDDVMEP